MPFGTRLPSVSDRAEAHCVILPAREMTEVSPTPETERSASGMARFRIFYEQPEKSISAGVTVVLGVTFSGLPIESKLVVFDDGTQSDTPPLKGANVFA